MNRTKKTSPAERVTWTDRSSLFSLLADIDRAHKSGTLTEREAKELRHDICGTWGVLYL